MALSGNTVKESSRTATEPAAVTVATTVVLVVDEEDKRRAYLIQALGKDLFLGFGAGAAATLTVANGLKVAADSTWADGGFTGPIYGVVATGTADVRIVEFG